MFKLSSRGSCLEEKLWNTGSQKNPNGWHCVLQPCAEQYQYKYLISPVVCNGLRSCWLCGQRKMTIWEAQICFRNPVHSAFRVILLVDCLNFVVCLVLLNSTINGEKCKEGNTIRYSGDVTARNISFVKLPDSPGYSMVWTGSQSLSNTRWTINPVSTQSISNCLRGWIKPGLRPTAKIWEPLRTLTLPFVICLRSW